MPSLPTGLRIYAIGDIHGRLDLLKQLREKIAADSATTTSKVQLIFLGDYIDRGLYSKQLIEYLINWHAYDDVPPIMLLGNHELVMRNILERKDETLLQDWMNFGGHETLMSYGIRAASFSGDHAAIIAALQEKVPVTHRNFLNKLELYATYGDYFFCHAGVEPGVPLAEQSEHSLVWIRRKFLDYKEKHPQMIIHGHSIALKAEFRVNRIGIDTGAYATGRLTALGLEDEKQWLVQTR